jgi:hypothetical protein
MRGRMTFQCHLSGHACGEASATVSAPMRGRTPRHAMGKATMTLVIHRNPVLSTERPGLSAEQRQALKLVANYRSATKALLLAHGVSRSMIANLVQAGLLKIEPQVIKAGWKTIDVARVRITPAGRDALTVDS